MKYLKKFHSMLTVVFVACCLNATPSFAMQSALELKSIFSQRVDLRLEVPIEEQDHYSKLLIEELHRAELKDVVPQYILLVDRSPKVQALFLFWLQGYDHAQFIGASPVSTGRKGGPKYFETPLGIFSHTAANPDFRAEGTENENGILGYGTKGMRVYGFGWATARKSWQAGNGTMRLQMHATDPRHLEARLGSVQSMGCIRIPATLNTLIDHYGLLDADYEQSISKGKRFWVLEKNREPTPWPGKYLIIIDSNRSTRPAWSPSRQRVG